MRADIHGGQEHKRSVRGPDTEAQDLFPPFLTSGLQRTAGPYKSVNTRTWAYRASRSVASFANGVRQPVSLSAGDMPRVCVKLRERADMSALCGLGEYFYEPLPPGRVRRSPRKVSLGLGI
jgi:hypothetical protein